MFFSKPALETPPPNFAAVQLARQRALAVPGPPIEFPKWIKIAGKDTLAINAEHESELMEAETARLRLIAERKAREDREAEAVYATAPAKGTAEPAPDVENLLSAPEKRGPGRPRVIRPVTQEDNENV